MTIELFNGDCLEVMQGIESGSIDAIICDPPYGTMKGAELDGWGKNKTNWDSVINHEKLLIQCNRVLRTNGALILFAQEPFTSKITTDTHSNLPFSYRLTWLKDHFANSLLANAAPVSYVEDICVFFKKYDTLNQHPLRDYSKMIMVSISKGLNEINNNLGHRQAEHFFYVNSTQFDLCTEKTYNQLIEKYKIDELDYFKPYSELFEINKVFNRVFNLHPNEKYKSNVLEYKKDYMGLHPTQKPVLLMQDLIYIYTNEGDTVLDFTMGSGTTGVAARYLERNFIGIEKDLDYFNIASHRINNELRQTTLWD